MEEKDNEKVYLKKTDKGDYYTNLFGKVIDPYCFVSDTLDAVFCLVSRNANTSIVLSGLAGTNSAQGQNRLGPQKAPVVTPAPDKTGIEETSTKSTYGIPVSAGLGVKIGLSPRWAVGIGANYTMLTRTFYGKYTKVNPDGTIASSTSSDIRNTQHYVGIPVNAYYNIISQDRVSLYAYGGGSVEKCISDDYNVLSTAISHKEKVDGLQFSANAGFGV